MLQENAKKDSGSPGGGVDLSRRRLPRWAPALVVSVAIAGAVILGLPLGLGVAGMAVLAAVIYLIAMPLWSRVVENGRAAKDRLMTGLVWCALLIALVPLGSLIWMVVKNGAAQIDGRFLTWSMRNIIDGPGGIFHALIGTLLITLGATLISVPIGMLTAIYCVEYGDKTRLTWWIRFLVDVMTGIPSIVAGLFAYALFAIVLGPGVYMGFGGSVALSLLMIPTVVRSTEEMLKLVPNDLREASYALGVPKWRTIVKVVIPTALAGIVTGVTLAIARVIGETAPLLIIAGAPDSVNFNLFSGQMNTLPVFIFRTYTQASGSIAEMQVAYNMAWGAALTLIVIVMTLNIIARVIGAVFSPKKGR